MKRILVITIVLLATFSARAQKKDILELSTVIERVLATYPTVDQAKEALRTAKEQIRQSRSGWRPVVSGTASYLWMEPISTMKFDGHVVDLGMRNNYDVGVNVSQVLYDFGKNRPKIESARLQEEYVRIKNEELYQSLALQAIQSYYLTGFARKAITIKQEELANYTRLLEEMGVKKETGSATEFDLLNTRVKHSATETELQTLYANRNTQQVNLSLLADTLVDDRILLADVSQPVFPVETLAELVRTGVEKRPEMVAARKQLDIAVQNEKLSTREYNPTLEVSASAGAKNGYQPHLDRLKMNYTVGATLRVPIYDGSNRRSEKVIGQSRAAQADAAIRLMAKQVENEIVGYYNDIASSKSKIELLTLQVQVAQKAYHQAEVNYRTGTITNLELLTSSTNVTNAKLQLEQEKINYTITFYRLMVAVGKNVRETN